MFKFILFLLYSMSAFSQTYTKGREYFNLSKTANFYDVKLKKEIQFHPNDGVVIEVVKRSKNNGSVAEVNLWIKGELKKYPDGKAINFITYYYINVKPQRPLNIVSEIQHISQITQMASFHPPVNNNCIPEMINPASFIGPIPIFHEKPLDIIPRKEWGAGKARGRNYEPKEVTEIIIHHTASPNKDLSVSEVKKYLFNIKKYHQSERRYLDIAYNFLIDPKGNVFEGTGMSTKGTHSPGHNSKSLGIALIGNFETKSDSNPTGNITCNKPTKEQKKMLVKLISKIKSTYTINNILRHKDTKKTACSGDCTENLIDEIGKESL